MPLTKTIVSEKVTTVGELRKILDFFPDDVPLRMATRGYFPRLTGVSRDIPPAEWKPDGKKAFLEIHY